MDVRSLNQSPETWGQNGVRLPCPQPCLVFNYCGFFAIKYFYFSIYSFSIPLYFPLPCLVFISLFTSYLSDPILLFPPIFSHLSILFFSPPFSLPLSLTPPPPSQSPLSLMAALWSLGLLVPLWGLSTLWLLCSSHAGTLSLSIHWLGSGFVLFRVCSGDQGLSMSWLLMHHINSGQLLLTHCRVGGGKWLTAFNPLLIFTLLFITRYYVSTNKSWLC